MSAFPAATLARQDSVYMWDIIDSKS